MKRSWKFYIIAIFVALGLVFELALDFKPEIDQTKVESNELSTMDFRPFNSNQLKSDQDIKSLAKKRRKSRTQKLNIKDFTFPTNHSFDESKKAAKKVAKKDDKKDDKKKKEEEDKKKKAEQKVTETSEPEFYNTEEDTPVENNDIAEAPQDVAGGGFAAPQAELDDNNIPQTFEEWIPLVLDSPDTKNTNKLIDYYQTRLVPASLFFELVTAMAEDSRPEMRRLGGFAAGSAPHAESFSILAMAINNESDSDLENFFRKQLYTYEKLSHIKILESVLLNPKSTDPSMVLAAEHIKRAAQIHLTTTSNKEPSSQSSEEETSNLENAPIFENFVAILGGLNGQVSSDVAISVDSTLQTLQDLLS